MKKLLMIGGAAMALLAAMPEFSFAAETLSQGCKSLNGTASIHNGSFVSSGNAFGTGFKEGEVIKFKVVSSDSAREAMIELKDRSVGGYPYTTIYTAHAPSGQFIITADVAPHQLLLFFLNYGEFTYECSSPPPPPSSNIQSDGSQIEGQNSQSAMNDMLDVIIDGTVGSSFQGFSGNEHGASVMVAPGQHVQPTADVPRVLESDDPWRMWMAGRYTHAYGSEDGDQFNGLAGTSYRIGQNAALGLFAGYEGFSYTDAAPAELSGNGLTLGGFAAGSFSERLKLDARAYTSFMNYDIDIGGTTGAFAGKRLGTSLTASYEMGNGITSVLPYVRGSTLFEWQDAYTDSAATAHASQMLSQGTIAPGLKLSHAFSLDSGATFTPYVGGEANWIFGNTNLAGFTGSEGLTGKVSAGANWNSAHGISLGLDTTYSGFGSTIKTQSVQGTLTIPF